MFFHYLSLEAQVSFPSCPRAGFEAVKSRGDVDLAAIHGMDDYFARAVARIRSQYQQAGLEFDVPPELMVRYGFGMLAGSVLLGDWFFPEGGPDTDVEEGVLARMLFKASEPRKD